MKWGHFTAKHLLLGYPVKGGQSVSSRQRIREAGGRVGLVRA